MVPQLALGASNNTNPCQGSACSDLATKVTDSCYLVINAGKRTVTGTWGPYTFILNPGQTAAIVNSYTRACAKSVTGNMTAAYK